MRGEERERRGRGEERRGANGAQTQAATPSHTTHNTHIHDTHQRALCLPSSLLATAATGRLDATERAAARQRHEVPALTALHCDIRRLRPRLRRADHDARHTHKPVHERGFDLPNWSIAVGETFQDDVDWRDRVRIRCRHQRESLPRRLLKAREKRLWTVLQRLEEDTVPLVHIAAHGVGWGREGVLVSAHARRERCVAHRDDERELRRGSAAAATVHWRANLWVRRDALQIHVEMEAVRVVARLEEIAVDEVCRPVVEVANELAEALRRFVRLQMVRVERVGAANVEVTIGEEDLPLLAVPVAHCGIGCGGGAAVGPCAWEVGGGMRGGGGELAFGRGDVSSWLATAGSRLK